MGKIKIGLEIHMYLNTKEKLFCDCCKAKKNDEVNSKICPICTGQPGAKPMLPNKDALFKTIKLGIIFGSKITNVTNFQRKQYTWPDMPVGFQRTVSGNVVPTGVGGSFMGIGIEELHLEEDPAAWDPVTGEINYNRAGSPLAEIVTKPEFESTDQLREWLKELVLVADYIDAIDTDFNIKSDVNVSIEETGFKRVEIKNVNSFTNIVNAAECEIERQRKLFLKGDVIKQETRRFNEQTNTTDFMRSKENAQDYMFIPEVDLPSIVIEDSLVEELRKSIPELACEKRLRYQKYGLSKEDCDVLVCDKYMAYLFESAIKIGLDPKESGLFLRREILRVLNYNKGSFEDLKNKNIDNQIIVLLSLLLKSEISYTTAQKLMEKLYDASFDVADYVKSNNLMQISDNSLLEELVDNAIKSSPKIVADYKSGNTKALNSIVGMVMNVTKGKANPSVVNKILLDKIKNL